jgi:hypothetical protein
MISFLIKKKKDQLMNLKKKEEFNYKNLFYDN